MLTWGFLSLLFLALTAIGSMVFLPLASTALALIYLYDEQKAKPVFLTISALALLGSVFLGLSCLIPTATAIVVGFGIPYAYVREKFKCSAALWLTILCAFSGAFLVYLFAAQITGTAEIPDIIAVVREWFLGQAEQAFTEISDRMTAYSSETIQVSDFLATCELAFDTLISVFPSLCLVFGFLITGLSFKFFASRVAMNDENPEPVYNWHFTVPGIFAWFYSIVFVLYVFFTSSTPFGAVVLNCMITFLPVFAYLGFKFLWMASKKSPNRGGTIRVLLIVGTVLFPTVAINLASLYGAFIIITVNRMANHRDDE